MKFLVLVATMTLARAKKVGSVDGFAIQESLNKMDKESLLRNARALQNNDAAFSIDGSFNIQFDGCTSLAVLSDEVMESVESGAGAFKATKDFVIFSAYNNYGSTQFAMDISTFVTAMASTILTENENYCEVCSEAQQSCMYNSQQQQNGAYYGAQQQSNGNYGNNNMDNGNDGNGANYGNNGNNGYQNNGNRKLEEMAKEPIDCDTCSSICSEQPYQGYNYQNMYSTEEAAEWLENVAQCQQLNYDEGYAIYSNSGYSYTRSYSSYNGNRYQSQEQQQQQYEQQQAQQYEMYAGMMCNAAGTGMEIGIFLDDECTVYDSAKTFRNMLTSGSAPFAYYQKTKNLIEFIFTKPVSCKATEYFSPFDADEQQSYYQNKNNYNYNAYEVPEANEGCQTLFDGTQVSVSDSCYTDYEYENEGSYNGEYTYYSSKGWQSYTYDIMDTEDQFQICTSIKSQISSGGAQTTNIQSKKSNLYNYKNNQRLEDIFASKSRVMGQLSGRTIALIVTAVLLSCVGLFALFKRCWSRRGNQDKKEALISKEQIS